MSKTADDKVQNGPQLHLKWLADGLKRPINHIYYY